MSMQLCILVAYILVLYGISWYATKQIQQGKGGALQYLLAGRNLPMIVMAAMLAGLAIGGASTVGVAEHAYKAGLSAGWYNAAWGTAGILAGIFAAHYFRRMEVNTIPEMDGVRKYSKCSSGEYKRVLLATQKAGGGSSSPLPLFFCAAFSNCYNAVKIFD